MILVGVRTDEQTGSVRVLLQNWWPDKQFVECDDAYIRASEGRLAFLTRLTIPDDCEKAHFVTTGARFAQSTLDTYDVSGYGGTSP
jgi:hypothetical protein